MLKLIQYIIFGHAHQWEIKEEIDVWCRSVSTERPIGKKIMLQCKTCGKLKTFKDY